METCLGMRAPEVLGGDEQSTAILVFKNQTGFLYCYDTICRASSVFVPMIAFTSKGSLDGMLQSAVNMDWSEDARHVLLLSTDDIVGLGCGGGGIAGLGCIIVVLLFVHS